MHTVICHVTRMEYPYICVAGIDPETLQHIRLVLPRRRRLHIRHWSGMGGKIGVGACIDPGPMTPVGAPPEIEDYEFEPTYVQPIRTLSPHELWDLLNRVAVNRLQGAFGESLKRTGRSFWAPAGECKASLACMHVNRGAFLFVAEGLNKMQVRIAREQGPYKPSLPINDLRFYQPTLGYPVNVRHVDAINRQLKSGGKALLTLGLTRPFASDDCHEPVHWLQVNGVFLNP